MKHLDSFLEMMSAERGASRNTLLAYKADIEHFFKFADKHETAVMKDDVKDYLHYLYSYKNTPKTQARRLSALREYFKFLYSEHLRPDIPTDGVDSPKLDKALPKYLSEEEVGRLIDAAEGLASENRRRLTALVELLYATGMRVSEMVTLPLSAFNPKAGYIYVKGKGNKERAVPLNDSAKQAVVDYLLVRDMHLKGGRESKWLFPSSSKTGHLTRDGFAKMLKDLAVQAGITPGRVSPHVLRHSFASHLVAHDANLLSVQQMLGHSDVKTTEIYTHVMDDRLRELVENAHPLSKKSTT